MLHFILSALIAITPISYKKEAYGNSLDLEVAKSMRYSIENKLELQDMSRWKASYPIVNNCAFASEWGALYWPKEAPGYRSPIGKYPVHSGHIRGTKLYCDQLLFSNTYDLKELSYSRTHLNELNALTLLEWWTYYFNKDNVLKHESLHAALEQSNQWQRDYRNFYTEVILKASTVSNGFRIIYVPPCVRDHDLEPAELKNYMSQLQEYNFKTYGRRIENAAEYQSLINSLNFSSHPIISGFENKIADYPFDVKRMFRAMNKLRFQSKPIFDCFLEWQGKVLPSYF